MHKNFTVLGASLLMCASLPLAGMAQELWTIPALDPADGSVVREISTVSVKIPLDDETQMMLNEENISLVTLSNANGSVLHGAEAGAWIPTDNYSAFLFPIIFDGSATEAGEWTLSIPSGVVYQVNPNDMEPIPGGAVNAPYTATYTVDPNAKSPVENYVIFPASGSKLNKLTSFNLIYPAVSAMQGYSAFRFTDEVIPGALSNGTTSYTLMGVFNQEYRESAAILFAPIDNDWSQLTVTEEGHWTLTIPAGFYTLNGEANPEIKLDYYVNPAYPEFPVTPEPGSEVSKLDTFTIDLFGASTVTIDEEMYVTLSGNGICAALDVHPSAERPSLYEMTLPAPRTEAGEYTLTIPAGFFHMEDDYGFESTNEEINITYTLKPDYILSPAPGTTVESLDVITIEWPGAKSVTFSGDNYGLMLTNGSSYATPCLNVTEVAGAAHPTFTLTRPSYTATPPMGTIRLFINEGVFEVDGEPSAEIAVAYDLKYEVNLDCQVEPANHIVVCDAWGAYWGFIFDESVRLSMNEDFDSKVSVIFNGEELEAGTDYMAMPEGNMLLFSIISPRYLVDGMLRVFIEEGALSVSGVDSPFINATFQVFTPREYDYVLSPADDSEVDALNEITITFPDAEEIEVFQEYGARLALGYQASENAAIEVKDTPEGAVAVLSFSKLPVENGDYTLTVNEGTFTLDGIFSSPAISATFHYDSLSGVSLVSADSKYTVVSIDGKLLLKDADSLDSLEKGFYIVNGKKAFINN